MKTDPSLLMVIIAAFLFTLGLLVVAAVCLGARKSRARPGVAPSEAGRARLPSSPVFPSNAPATVLPPAIYLEPGWDCACALCDFRDTPLCLDCETL